MKRAGGIGGGLIAILLALLLGGNSPSSAAAEAPPRTPRLGGSGFSLPQAQSQLMNPSSSSWGGDSNLAKLNTSVAPGAREKYTKLVGNGQDTVTLMVYMCGTDLESRYGMATKDLTEMANANLSDKVNLIVFTGGCKQWQTSGISNSVNQIFRVRTASSDPGGRTAATGSMTDPNNLLSFIQFCKQNFPANRNSRYADYLIASEETEPGIGWYYTNWLNKLSQNTSTSTLEIGKQIVDDFVDVCAQQCRGQQTTLSLVDLAELGSTLSDSFSAFSQNTSKLITSDNYKTVAKARSSTREFAGSSSIDQIDMVHFAKNLGTAEAKNLADVLLSSVKYNRCANITNAYGLSIYFPYKKAGGVDTAVKINDRIGLDSAYSDCIREFANLEVCGQAATGGTGSALPSLLGQLMGSQGGSSSAAAPSAQDVAQLLSLFMGGRGATVSGIDSSNTGFMFGRSITTEQAAEYIANNRFDPSNLVWTERQRPAQDRPSRGSVGSGAGHRSEHVL